MRPSLATSTKLKPGQRPVPSWIVRVLGARMATQAVVELAAPTPTVSRAGAAVDAIHVASMLAVAAVSRGYRRAALRSAAVAGAPAIALGVLSRAATGRP